jgi:Trk K+ transport system NAD-binding subunit
MVFAMHRSQKRLIALLIGLVVFLIVSALIYQAGMARLEHSPRTFWQAFEWATETLSTTGYGADAKWSHPVMVLFVSLIQIAGVFLFFLIIPVFLVPFLEERFEEKLPRAAPEHIGKHVVVFRYGPAVETLLQQLALEGVATLVVETDEAAARAVLEKQQAVVFTRNDEDALSVCNLDSARALVANGRDEENAGLILRARQQGFTREIYAFVEEPAHRKPMELAGATAAYTPRHIVAAALAAHASETISPRLPGAEAIGGLVRRELRVPSSSAFAGKTIREAALSSFGGATIVGQWRRSRLQPKCTASTIIEPGAILEVVGDHDAISRATTRLGATLLRADGPYLIAGFGEVGRKLHELLTDAGESVCVVEKNDARGVDFVGDVLDLSVLERAGLQTSRALMLALNTDDATLFACVIAREAAPDVPVIARVNHARNLDNIHRAGADYALSISDISGEMLSSRLLGRGRARDERRRVVRMHEHEYGGMTIGELAHECVIAIDRDGDIVRPLDPELRIGATDILYVCT